MAKKTLWKDNTMPPTNYLWLKVDKLGEIVGLFEWDGIRWVKVDDNSGSGSSEPTSAGYIKYIDLEGNEHTISTLKDSEEQGLLLVDSDGNSVGSVSSESYIDSSVNNAVNNALYEETVSEEGDTIYVIKTEIINQIAENSNVWIED